MSAPRRLFDDPSATEALRDDLRVAAEAEPRYDAERGLLALQAAVATLGHGAPLAEGLRQAGSQAGSQAASSATEAAGHAGAAANGGGALAASGTKLTLAAVATVVSLGIAGTVAWMLREPAPPVARPTPAVVAPPPALAPEPEPAPAEPEVAPARVLEPVQAAEAVRMPATSHKIVPQRLARAGAVAPVDPDLALRQEIDHLARVKALLEREPRAAYELAQAGNRTLSAMFKQERDGLSVLALDAAGDHARAQQLARRFLRRYPDSPLRERIAGLVAPGTRQP